MAAVACNTPRVIKTNYGVSLLSPKTYSLQPNLNTNNTYFLIFSKRDRQEPLLAFLKSNPEVVNVIYEGPWAVNHFHNEKGSMHTPVQKLVIIELTDKYNEQAAV